MAKDSFAEYRRAIQKALVAGDATEHTHRPALKTLIEALAKRILRLCVLNARIRRSERPYVGAGKRIPARHLTPTARTGYDAPAFGRLVQKGKYGRRSRQEGLEEGVPAVAP